MPRTARIDSAGVLARKTSGAGASSTCALLLRITGVGSVLLIGTAELCTATHEIVVAFLDDREGLDAVLGQVYEVQVRFIEKIILEGPCAHPFEEIHPHVAHKNQGFVGDLLSIFASSHLRRRPDRQRGCRSKEESRPQCRNIDECILDLRKKLANTLLSQMGYENNIRLQRTRLFTNGFFQLKPISTDILPRRSAWPTLFPTEIL
jgi:hypothetical protein